MSIQFNLSILRVKKKKRERNWGERVFCYSFGFWPYDRPNNNNNIQPLHILHHIESPYS